jgi:hypothetical protein
MATQTAAAPKSVATVDAAKAAKRVASQEAVMNAVNNSSASTWISGLTHSTYTDCYDSATGELKTFYTSSSYEKSEPGQPRVLKAESERKIGGRILLNKENREVKFYNGFLQHLSGVPGVTGVEVTKEDGSTFPFTEIKGAQFGIFAKICPMVQASTSALTIA